MASNIARYLRIRSLRLVYLVFNVQMLREKSQARIYAEIFSTENNFSSYFQVVSCGPFSPTGSHQLHRFQTYQISGSGMYQLPPIRFDHYILFIQDNFKHSFKDGKIKQSPPNNPEISFSDQYRNTNLLIST